jgi:hypothetical protein
MLSCSRQLEADGVFSDRRRLSDFMATAVGLRSLSNERAAVMQQHFLFPTRAAQPEQPRIRIHAHPHHQHHAQLGDPFHRASHCFHATALHAGSLIALLTLPPSRQRRLSCARLFAVPFGKPTAFH